MTTSLTPVLPRNPHRWETNHYLRNQTLEILISTLSLEELEEVHTGVVSRLGGDLRDS